MLLTLASFAFVITVLVFIHELGHYLAARSVGMRVEKFSVGFPPRFLSFTSVQGGWNFKVFFYKRNEKGRNRKIEGKCCCYIGLIWYCKIIFKRKRIFLIIFIL